MVKFVNHRSEVHEQALASCDAIYHERRILLKQEIGRMVLFFSDQPSLLAPNIQVTVITDFFKPPISQQKHSSGTLFQPTLFNLDYDLV